jgi:hypothetical protein
MSEAAYLIEQAERCRRLAMAINDVKTTAALHRMAEEYERRALEIADRPSP